jgi:hypothetical protein
LNGLNAADLSGFASAGGGFVAAGQRVVDRLTLARPYH